MEWILVYWILAIGYADTGNPERIATDSIPSFYTEKECKEFGEKLMGSIKVDERYKDFTCIERRRFF